MEKKEKTNRFDNTCSVFFQFLSLIILTICLVKPCSCLAIVKEKKPPRADEVLLAGAVGELEDALSRLKQFVNYPKAGGDSSNLEQQINRQDPEPGDGLDRIELPEQSETFDILRQNSDDYDYANNQPSDKYDISEISLQDFVSILRDNIKDSRRRSDSQQHGQDDDDDQDYNESLSNASPALVPDEISTARTSVSTQSSLPQRKKLLAENEAKSKAAINDIGELSLMEALEYLANMKRKLHGERIN